MKKGLMACSVFLVLMGGILLAQEAEIKGYPYEMDKKVATAVFAEKTYDQVWGVVIKSIIASNYKTTMMEKDAGLIEAVHIKSGSARFMDNLGGQKTDESSITVMVEAQGDTVVVSLRWEKAEKFTLRRAKTNRNRICSALYDKMAELLYGEAEKK